MCIYLIDAVWKNQEVVCATENTDYFFQSLYSKTFRLDYTLVVKKIYRSQLLSEMFHYLQKLWDLFKIIRLQCHQTKF